MTPRHSFKFFLLFATLITIVISSVTYAYASTDTAYPNIGGDGTGSISGYVITDVVFHQGSDQSQIDSVSFTLSAEARNVKIKLTNTQSSWFDCAFRNDNNWICYTAGATIKSANELRVIASNN